jgi:hypothetical protein
MRLMHPMLWITCTALIGCATIDDEDVDGPDDQFLTGGKADGLEEGSAEARAVLRVANHASLVTLDDRVPLDVRAARNIVGFRAGPDGVEGTADDRRFTTLAELDAISYVGPVAFGKLLGFVHRRQLADVFPSGSFSIAVSVKHPVTTARFNAIAQGGPYNLGDSQASTPTRSFTISSDGSTIKISTGTLGLRIPQPATIGADGRFSFSTYEEGITQDQRRIYWNKAELSGHVDPLGEVVIDRVYIIGGSGNHLYGYQGTITESTGRGFGELPFVDVD